MYILLKLDIDKCKQQKGPKQIKAHHLRGLIMRCVVRVAELQKRRMGDLQQDMTFKQTHSSLRKRPVIFRLTPALHLQPSPMTI